MSSLLGQPLDALDTPQLLLDLDVIDANLKRMFDAGKARGVNVRTHFKSLKCGGLAQYIQARGGSTFLCAKLNEAEVLADAGITDILIANQIVSPLKMQRLASLAKRVQLRVCVDHADNIDQLSRAMQHFSPLPLGEGPGVRERLHSPPDAASPKDAEATRSLGSATGSPSPPAPLPEGEGRTAGTPLPKGEGRLGVLVEIDIGMARCGVLPGEAAVPLAQRIAKSPGLRFDGLQGYDGHLQLIADANERKAKCLQGMEQLIGTRRFIEQAGIPVNVVTGAGTGTWEFVAGYPGVTEIQPGSFVLMDCVYQGVRPEFGCSLSILAMVMSVQQKWYTLDAGSKAISKDFGMPMVKGKPEETATRLSEEHTKVECYPVPVKVGDRREVLPAHCCATMNLHRQAVAVRKGKVEAVWPIEASGRYD